MPPVQTRLPSSSSPSSPTLSRPRTPFGASPTSPNPNIRPNAPYMVALSGWPEPIYISNRSRPSTPRASFPGEVSDGIPNLPPLSNNVPLRKMDEDQDKTHAYRPGNRITEPTLSSGVLTNSTNNAAAAHHRKPKDPSINFPTSSTRTPTHSPPPQSPPTSFAGRPSHRHGTFPDPRLAPNVAIHSDRPLPVVPNWTSGASSNNNHSVGVGMGVTVPAGERGTGILVMRSVPDVYPPPGPPGMAGMVSNLTRSVTTPIGGGGKGRQHIGVATEVYPRDPNSAFLWGGTTGVPGRGTDSATDEMMETDQDRAW